MTVCVPPKPIIYASIIGEKPKGYPLREERMCIGFEILNDGQKLPAKDENFILMAEQVRFYLVETSNGVEILLGNENSLISVEEKSEDFQTKPCWKKPKLLYPFKCTKSKLKSLLQKKQDTRDDLEKCQVSSQQSRSLPDIGIVDDNTRDDNTAIKLRLKSRNLHPQNLDTIKEEDLVENSSHQIQQEKESLVDFSTSNNVASKEVSLTQDRVTSVSKKRKPFEHFFRKSKIAKLTRLPEESLKQNYHELDLLLSYSSKDKEDHQVDCKKSVRCNLDNNLYLETLSKTRVVRRRLEDNKESSSAKTHVEDVPLLNCHSLSQNNSNEEEIGDSNSILLVQQNESDHDLTGDLKRQIVPFEKIQDKVLNDSDIFEIVECGFLFMVIRYLILYAC